MKTENRTGQILILVKPEIKQDVRFLAAREGMTLSSYVNRVLENHVQREKKAEASA